MAFLSFFHVDELKWAKREREMCFLNWISCYYIISFLFYYLISLYNLKFKFSCIFLLRTKWRRARKTLNRTLVRWINNIQLLKKTKRHPLLLLLPQKNKRKRKTNYSYTLHEKSRLFKCMFNWRVITITVIISNHTSKTREIIHVEEVSVVPQINTSVAFDQSRTDCILWHFNNLISKIIKINVSIK